VDLVILLWLFRLIPACPAEGWVTSEYGYRQDPIHHRRKFHQGIDIANKAGSPIYSPWQGEVTRVSRSRWSGRFVVVQSGELQLTFLHLQEATVAKGDQLWGGDQIGLMGSSGRATGPHVHLEMRHEGKTKDPSVALLLCPTLP
jgi:murein DD-endopeptidase MepM/ murein hydrolase activator NlpD